MRIRACVRAYYVSVYLVCVCVYESIHVYVLGVCARMSICLRTSQLSCPNFCVTSPIFASIMSCQFRTKCNCTENGMSCE